MAAKKENRARKRPTTRAGRRGDPCLNIKQLLFVDEYLVDFNGAAAAVRAGYSEKSAAQTAYKLLRNAHVLDRVMRRIQQRMKDAEQRADDEWKRIEEIAFGQLTDLVSWNRDGVTVTPSEELTAKGRATVKELTICEDPLGGSKTTIKARDPLPALKMLAERREKEKAAKQDDEAPRHMGTIIYFDRGARTQATIETQPNDSSDRDSKRPAAKL